MGYTTAAGGGNNPTPSGPQPGSAPNPSLVNNNVQNDTVIVSRGAPGIDKATLRRLSPEDRKGLKPAGDDQTSDINTEVDKLVKSTDKAHIREVQQRLVDAGLLDKNNYLPGYVDSNTTKAYATLLEEASRSGRSIDEAFSDRSTAVKEAGGIGSGAVKRQALSIALADFTSVNEAVKALAPSIIGRNPSSDEIKAIQSGYNALQTAAQTADYNNSAPVDGGGVGGSFHQAPSLADYVKSQLEATHPNEYAATSEANALNTFFDLINGAHSFDNAHGVNP